MKYQSVATKFNSTLKEYTEQEIKLHLKELAKNLIPKTFPSSEEQKKEQNEKYRRWVERNKKKLLKYKSSWAKESRKKAIPFTFSGYFYENGRTEITSIKLGDKKH